jgi:Protein of unknown function (DUF1116)
VEPESPGLAALNTTTVRAVGVRPAGEVCAAVAPRRFLHAGPPIALADVVGPARGAFCGALVFEGEAADVAEAERILARGDLELVPCQDVGAAGAMAGVVTPRMPVVVAECSDGSRTFAPLNEGLGKALRFGSYDDDILARLRWMGDVAGPLLDAAIDDVEGVDVTELQSEGLRRGDECHNRNIASSAGLVARLAPSIVRMAGEPGDAADLLAFMAGNPHFFLSFSIASAKGIGDAAHRAAEPGLVTAICANGRSMGVRVSGLGDRWLLADAPVGKPKLFPGYRLDDVCPAMGDSYMTEVVGLGAFALVAAPALSRFTGGDPTQSARMVDELRRITRGTSVRWLVPSEGFAGTPLGIDVGRVSKTGVAPLVNNGLAHRTAGVGQVGAGLTRLPLEPFVQAADALGTEALRSAREGAGTSVEP